MVNSCTLICMGAAALFGSMLYVSFNPYKHDVLTQFINTLDSQQQQIFLQIHEERMKIFVLALIIGLICGTIVLLFMSEHGIIRSCSFTLVTLTVTYLVYILYPKSKYILNYLVRPNQKTAWLRVYKTMQYRSYMGMLLGAGAYLLVSLIK
jgi:hypothetical protein